MKEYEVSFPSFARVWEGANVCVQESDSAFKADAREEINRLALADLEAHDEVVTSDEGCVFLFPVSGLLTRALLQQRALVRVQDGRHASVLPSSSRRDPAR